MDRIQTDRDTTTRPRRPIASIVGVVYTRMQHEVATVCRPLVQTLERVGCDSRAPQRARFDEAILSLVIRIRTASDNQPPLSQLTISGAPDKRRFLVHQVLLGFGIEESAADSVTKTLMTATPGTLNAARSGALLSTDPAVRFIARQLTIAFHGGVHLHRRLRATLADVGRPYRGAGGDLDAGVEQTADLLGMFPDLATPVYRAVGFRALHSFPPQDADRTNADESAFRSVIARELESRQTWETVGVVGLIVVGVALTVITAGAAGPLVATLAGAGIGLAQGTSMVVLATQQRQHTRDAAVAGLASASRVEYDDNELAGAWGALAVSVVTLGAASRIGGGQVVSQVVRGMVLGGAGGAATTLLNPNVVAADDTLGIVVIGTLTGAAGATLGTLTGSTVNRLIAGATVQVGIPTGPGGAPLKLGDRLQVSVGKNQPPVDAEFIGVSGNRIRFLLRDGAPYEVHVARIIGLASDVPDAPLLVRSLSKVRPQAAPRGTRGPQKLSTAVLRSAAELPPTAVVARIRLGVHSRVSRGSGSYASADTVRFTTSDGLEFIAFRAPDGAAHLLHFPRGGSHLLARVDGRAIDDDVLTWMKAVLRGGIGNGPSATAPGTVRTRPTSVDVPPPLRGFLARLQVLYTRTGSEFDTGASRFHHQSGVLLHGYR